MNFLRDNNDEDRGERFGRAGPATPATRLRVRRQQAADPPKVFLGEDDSDDDDDDGDSARPVTPATRLRLRRQAAARSAEVAPAAAAEEPRAAVAPTASRPPSTPPQPPQTGPRARQRLFSTASRDSEDAAAAPAPRAAVPAPAAAAARAVGRPAEASQRPAADTAKPTPPRPTVDAPGAGPGAGPAPNQTSPRPAAASDSAGAATGAAAGPPRRAAPSRPATGPVHVLWDLDNKYPLVLDHTRVVSNMRSALRKHGKVVEIRAYCNYQTLNHVPELWEEALDEGMQHPLDSEEPEELRCPLCGRRCKDEEQLAKHFRQLHEREHKKRMSHNPKVKKYKQSDKYARYQDAVRVAAPKRRGFNLEGILKAAGVAVMPVQMGPQRADVALEKDAMGLLERVEAPSGPDQPRPVLCLVTDDHGFESLLKLFQSRGWATVVISNSPFRNAGARVEWHRVVDLPE